jgi:hypothetical protein
MTVFRNSFSLTDHHTTHIHVGLRTVHITNGQTKMYVAVSHGTKHTGNLRKEAPVFQDSNTIFELTGQSVRRRKHLKQRSPFSSRIRNTTVKCVNAQNSKCLVSSLNAEMISAFKSVFFRQAVKTEQKHNYRQGIIV